MHSVNLIDNRAITAELIAAPYLWRVRAVEEITVDAATSCLRRRSLQVAPLRPLLRRYVPRRATHALIGVNVAPMPRGPLVDFDISGPGGPAWLLPRTEIAQRQALYLTRLARALGIKIGNDVEVLLVAILGFTGQWVSNGAYSSFREYLSDGLGISRSVPVEFVDQWESIGRVCRYILRPRLDAFRNYSAPENPGLVLPELFVEGTLRDEVHATEVLSNYRELLIKVNALADPSEPNAADEFLDALADYSNYYDLVAALEVPLDEPFLIKFSERRDLRLSRFDNNGTQELVISDATTNHVTFKVNDPNIRITDFQALNPHDGSTAFGAFLSRKDEQVRAFYAHDRDRDYRILLSFGLAVLRRLQIVPYIAGSLLLLLAIVLVAERPAEVRTLALVLGPSALAVSVLLAREPSTLGSRLRFQSSIFLLVALAGVLAAASWVYFATHFS